MKFVSINIISYRKVVSWLLMVVLFFSLSLTHALAGNLNETQLRTLGTSISKDQDFISTDELADWIMQDKQDYMLIDIRSPDAFNESHIQGAVNIPLISLFSMEQISQLPAQKTIVVYSNANMRAGQAAVMLRLTGLNAYSLMGGYEHWVMHTLNPEAATAQDPNMEQLNAARRAAIARALKNCDMPYPCQAVPAQGYVPPLSPVTEPPPPATGGGVLLDEGC
jgi:rhodanese-related sulfurtransferase